MSDPIAIVAITGAGLLFTALAFYVVARKRKIALRQAAFLGGGFLLYFCLALVIDRSTSFEGLHVAASPLAFALSTIPVVVGLWLFHHFLTVSARDVPAEPERLLVKAAVARVLTSDAFLTSLGEAVATGSTEADERWLREIGLVLANLDLRNRRNRRYATGFLLATIGLAGVSLVVVLFFGWAMLYEKSAGVPAQLDRIESRLESAATDLQIATGVVRDRFAALVKERFASLAALSPDADNAEVERAVDEALAPLLGPRARFSTMAADFDPGLIDRLARAKDALKNADQPANRQYRAAINAATSSAAAYSFERMRSLESALDDLKEIKREVADLVRGWGSGDAPVLELLRRLAIGVVVCTFMFGVLRYVAGVYARYYDEARRGEDEYLQIRKLVAAYRAAASASESQKALLGAFLGGDGDPPVAAKPDEALTNEAAGLIKEILGNLARKI